MNGCLRVRISHIHAYIHTHIHTYIHTYIPTCKHTNILEANALDSVVMCACTGGRRPIGCLIFIGHFPHKSPILRGSFVKIHLQLEAAYGSSPPCNMQSYIHAYLCVCTYMHAYMYIRIYVKIHICMITHMYIYIHIYIHMYV